MARSQETYGKKEVRNKKEKKRKAKEEKRLAKKEGEKKSSFEDMIAYVDENGQIVTEKPDPAKKVEVKLEDIDSQPKNRNSLNEESSRRKGVVDFFNDSKGFGFIKDLQTKNKVFVHINNVEGEIKEGNLVEYDMEKGPKGLMAVDVKITK
jgi:cold shock CspA family protein